MPGGFTTLLLDLITAVWLGCIGACVGSFLNVVAYRMPLGASVVWMPSQCPACSYPIRFRDNVPILGWVLLRGRCRDCGIAISPRYVAVEAVMAATFMLLATIELYSGGANLPGERLSHYGGAWGTLLKIEWDVVALYAFHCAVLSLLMGMVLIDLDLQRVPTKLALLTAGLIVVAAYYGAFIFPDSPRWIYDVGPPALVDAALGTASLGVLGLITATALRLSRRAADNVLFFNLPVACGVAGGVCGFRAAVSIAVMWAFLFVVLRRLRPKLAEDRGLTLPCLWSAVLIQILLWEYVAKFVPVLVER